MSDISWQDDTEQSPRDAARALEALAPWAQYGTLAIGVVYALESLSLLISDRPSFTAENRMTLRVTIVTTLLLYGVAGWTLGRVLAALGRLVESQRARAEAAARTVRWCEESLTPLLARLALSFERAGDGSIAPVEARPTGAAEALVALRRAMATREWAAAEERLREFVLAFPEHPETSRVTAELARGREAATHDLLARIDAARAAGDADRVLELREALTPLLSGDPLHALDRDLAKWFLQVIQKRLRGGDLRQRPDIPLLAARIADALDTTPEGASLRASLPTLRRSAGLCARCAEPYTGIADACPKCVAAAHAAAPPPPTAAPEVEGHEEADDVGANGRADDPFLRDDLDA